MLQKLLFIRSFEMFVFLHKRFGFLWCQGLSGFIVFLAAGGTPHPLQVIALFFSTPKSLYMELRFLFLKNGLKIFQINSFLWNFLQNTMLVFHRMQNSCAWSLKRLCRTPSSFLPEVSVCVMNDVRMQKEKEFSSWLV